MPQMKAAIRRKADLQKFEGQIGGVIEKIDQQLMYYHTISC